MMGSSETYDLPKFPLKRQLSDGAWTMALAPPTPAKIEKKYYVNKMSAGEPPFQRYLNQGPDHLHPPVKSDWARSGYYSCSSQGGPSQ